MSWSFYARQEMDCVILVLIYDSVPVYRYATRRLSTAVPGSLPTPIQS